MNHKQLCFFLFGVLAFGLQVIPANAQTDVGVQFRVIGEAEPDRYLGTRDDDDDRRELGVELQPWLFSETATWRRFVLAQAFTSTDSVLLESGTVQTTAKEFIALREMWVDYRGATGFPGEFIRFGRQRIKIRDGLWWDTAIESLRWVFDSTLLKWHLGLAQRFDTFRSDDDVLDPEEEDRLHAFAQLSWQWRPGHWLGSRIHLSDDTDDLSDNPTDNMDVDDEPLKTENASLLWLGLVLNGNFFDRHHEAPLSYWVNVMGLAGEATRIDPVSGQPNTERDVNAGAVDLGVRWRLRNWRLGTAYTWSGGDDGDDDSQQFRQTGLQSNRSNFTGTRTRFYRYGEAYRADLGNLEVATLFVAWIHQNRLDASLVWHRFQRVNAFGPVNSDTVNLDPVAGNKDLGSEVDLVVTRYFNAGFLPYDWLDDDSAYMRFRAGVFQPGEAYGDGDDSLNRAFFDFVWRF